MRTFAPTGFAALLMTAIPAFAGTPSETVRVFYDKASAETDPALRNRFTDPALTVLDNNDRLAAAGEGTCLDENMALDNAVFDKAAIDASLKTAEAIRGNDANVLVAFKAGDDLHRLEWKLKRVGDDWKVADIVSGSGEWQLSQYNCQ